MAKITVVPYSYVPGGTYGCCPVCNFKVRLNDMRMRWDGLRVCEADWEPRPDTMNPPNIFPEGLVRPDAAPDMPDVFIQSQVTPDQL